MSCEVCGFVAAVCSACTDREAREARAEERAKVIAEVVALLKQNGCDCFCDHHPEEHDEDCERCLACRIADAVGGEP